MRRWSGSVGLLALVAVLAGCDAGGDEAHSAGVRVLDEHSIAFDAVVSIDGFESGAMAGYHLVVWRGGRAADQALFRAEVSDLEVLDALEGLGAEPGDALSIASWDRRDDPAATEPERVVLGPALNLEVVVPGASEPLSLQSLLTDPGGRGIALRFGGHRDNIPAWRSGCVVCLYSCPGGKVGNASYTVRDFVAGATRFRVVPGLLPPDGTAVEIVLRLAPTQLRPSVRQDLPESPPGV